GSAGGPRPSGEPLRAEATWAAAAGTAWRPLAPAAPPRRPEAATWPSTARLSDAVPAEVNTASDGRHPRCSARDSRASSTRRRARRPEPWRDDALPTVAAVSA